MGYSSFLILRDGVGDKRDLALGLYASQLALNWVDIFESSKNKFPKNF